MNSGGGVRRIEITERESPMFGGVEFADVGNYERLHGTVFGELDPRHRLNASIVNLDKAARNPRGHVEYHSDFRILNRSTSTAAMVAWCTTCPIAATNRSWRGSTARRTAGTPNTPATAS